MARKSSWLTEVKLGKLSQNLKNDREGSPSSIEAPLNCSDILCQTRECVGILSIL